jgi:hypothetical protein
MNAPVKGGIPMKNIDEQREAADDKAWEGLQARRVWPEDLEAEDEDPVWICNASGIQVYPYQCNMCKRTECKGRKSYAHS